MVFAAAFLLAPVGFGQSDVSDEPVIDTAATVEKTQCMPCHIDLGDVNQPGLIFNHGNHLLVSCDGCHARMPHKDGATEKVPMEVCFACHGVQHGPQGELATGECVKCHTPSFTLRPKTHTESWPKKPHADAANASGVNGCMMCHDAPEDCDACHKAEKLDIPPMPDGYHTMIQPRPKDPSIKMYPDGEVSMSQCVYCHPDLDAITPGRLIFAHAEHIQRNYSCEACHPTFAHQESGTQKPDMMSCYRCHGLDHNGGGQVATEECDSCHPKEFELMPNDHTKPFIMGEHNKPAAEDPAYCAMCHDSETFCTPCHRGEKSSPNAPGRPVIPQSHKKAEWIPEHGGDYLNGDGACGTCHTDQSCKRCHKTVMPHPVGWIENHTPEPGVPSEDCNVCHTDRRTCQNCHHNSVAKGALVAENCTPCHDEMKQKPATAIQHKGFAEHAVHFNVAIESVSGGQPKKRPYTCDDCHIGFSVVSATTTGEPMNGTLPSAGHDVRLCYSCHGNVNFRNEIIAPWPGAQLCTRCHTDLNV